MIALTHSTIQNGGTALGEASIGGHYKVVELLLGAGANPNLQDKVSIGQIKILPYFWCLSFPPVLHVFICAL